MAVAQPDLEVVIVSFNVRALLRSCLESVYRCAGEEGLAARLWVVDNASEDGSAAMVQESFPEARLLTSQQNVGFARGCNVALRALGYPLTPLSRAPLLLLNPDTEVMTGALSQLLADLSALPRAAVVGPGLRYGDGSLQHSAFAFPGLWQVALEFFPLNWRLTEGSLNGRYPSLEQRSWPFPCDHPLGAAMLVRPEALQEVGLLDERFFMYCEEVDWCWRAKRLGWEVWSDPRALVVHHAGRSTAQSRGAMYVQLWRSRYELLQKHRGSLYLRLVRSVARLGIVKEWARAAAAQVRAAKPGGAVAGGGLADVYREVLRL